jgi:hypothetical protein
LQWCCWKVDVIPCMVNFKRVRLCQEALKLTHVGVRRQLGYGGSLHRPQN